LTSLIAQENSREYFPSGYEIFIEYGKIKRFLGAVFCGNLFDIGQTAITSMKLIYFISEDWFFCSHFIERAVAAKNAGFHVLVITRVNKHAEMIQNRGLEIIPLALDRTKLNILSELALIKKLLSIYKREKPQIVHHIALKPILYGTLAAKLAGVPAIVNAPVGMGYVFSSAQLKAKLLKPLVTLALRMFLNPADSIAVFENPDDLDFFEKAGIVQRSRTRLIRGAGVDMREFSPAAEPAGVPVVVLAARMLWDKGIGEFVQAARFLRSQSIQARFVLVGAPDHDNPACIAESQLKAWQEEGVIEWWGFRDDMPAIFKQAHIVCLPSYAEGLPRVLIEAAACGKPIVATNVPGCREIVKNAENGLLAPAKSVMELAGALADLIQNPELRKTMGNKGRGLAIREFSSEQVIRETLDLYQTLNA
jgi:glycosyltransferase involved in cell wall biosynthesis